MSERDIIAFLEDIIISCQKIQKYIKGLTYSKFRKNDLVIDGVIRNLEIIGEATKKIPISFRKEHSQIDWKKIAGLRDILMHDYFGIDYEILWDIVKNKVPILNGQVSKIIEKIKNNLRR